MSKERVETYSDGVFAIVTTLLIFGLRAPQIASHSSLSQYARAMAPLLPNLVSFVLSFLTISVHWVSHHYFFRHLDHVTVGLVWMNNFFLLWLCLLPFPTALLGDHPTDQFPILLYALDSLLCALSFYAFRIYARRAKLFKEDEYVRTQGPRRSLPAIGLYLLSIPLVFVSPYLSLACFFIVPILYFVPNLIQTYIH
jgi:TMEM175 potassium channel family protein